eukprot:233709-Prymnesium_polylepis.1
MQCGGEVQAGPSGTATPAGGARGGRPIFSVFARMCAPHEKITATLLLASLVAAARLERGSAALLERHLPRLVLLCGHGVAKQETHARVRRLALHTGRAGCAGRARPSRRLPAGVLRFAEGFLVADGARLRRQRGRLQRGSEALTGRGERGIDGTHLVGAASLSGGR